jgi:Uma2 family endonuclease
VQPDLLFISKEHLSIVKEDLIAGAPDLIAEILSPSNWIVDRRDKFGLYAEAGVKEYWIIDLDSQTVEVFTLQAGAYALAGRYGVGETARSALLAGFEIPVDRILGG